mmetsp:Transcript_921/g.2273  ORF Transcript_921/g.2273 Transcript_921/m.2273 type:complete len:208 (+) Transcript_921:2463-3086(+)
MILHNCVLLCSSCEKKIGRQESTANTNSICTSDYPFQHLHHGATKYSTNLFEYPCRDYLYILLLLLYYYKFRKLLAPYHTTRAAVYSSVYAMVRRYSSRLSASAASLIFLRHAFASCDALAWLTPMASAHSRIDRVWPSVVSPYRNRISRASRGVRFRTIAAMTSACICVRSARSASACMFLSMSRSSCWPPPPELSLPLRDWFWYS